MESQSEFSCSERSPPARAELTGWDIDEWLQDSFGEIYEGTYFIRCHFIPVVFDPLQLSHWLQSVRGGQKHRLGECWGKCWYLYLFLLLLFFPKHSTSDNVPMIALWMPNYSVITWGFVVLFRVAKSEFNISSCCFSFLVVFFLLLWQCFLDFWLKKLNFESIHIHASFSFRPLCNYDAEQRWGEICVRTPFLKK